MPNGNSLTAEAGKERAAESGSEVEETPRL